MLSTMNLNILETANGSLLLLSQIDASEPYLLRICSTLGVLLKGQLRLEKPKLLKI